MLEVREYTYTSELSANKNTILDFKSNKAWCVYVTAET